MGLRPPTAIPRLNEVLSMGSILSGVLGYAGQRQSNEIQQEEFASNQSFNADQAALNRSFQSAMLGQVEQYDTLMSDTAMQRRVKDLEASGLNPLLAVGQGGASAPLVGAPSGSQASSGGIANIGNAMQAGINSAQTAAATEAYAAQARAADAQAKKTTSETPTAGHPTVVNGEVVVQDPESRGHELGDATLANIQANTGVSVADATRIGAVTNQIMHTMDNVDADTALKQAQTLLSTLTRQQLQGTMQALISIANADAKYKSLETDAFEKMSVAERNRYLGPIIGTARALLGPIATAVGVSKVAGSMMGKGADQAPQPQHSMELSQ